MTEKKKEETKPTRTANDIRVEINQLIQQRGKLFENVNQINSQIGQKYLELYELSPEFIKVVCPNCSGKGFIQEDKRKRVCENCDGREFVWMIKYEK